ncbi:MAG: proton-conducting transporter membrane subunit [Verrucomicrobium sp.]|nr:proton-conducting transporter membrane subunit [Verrucomicrobium sp.]
MNGLLLPLPETILVVLGLFLLGRRWRAARRGGGLVVAGTLAALLLEFVLPRQSGFYGFGLYLWDGTALFFQVFVLAATACCALLGLLTGARPRWPFLLFSAAGLVLQAAVNDFLLLFLAWTASFLPAALALAGGREASAAEEEASVKTLFLAMVGGVLLALGIALIFGVAGSTRFDVVAGVLETHDLTPALAAGLLLVLAGLGFTIGAVPFHFWAPDAQQGASIPLSAFLAVAFKGAGCAALLRVLDLPFGGVAVEGVALAALALTAVLSLALGSLAGLPQRNGKRLLGYAGIAHAGFFLAALAANSRAGSHALCFLLVSYFLAVFPVLAAIALSASPTGGRPQPGTLAAFAGLGRRAPLLAWAAALGLASLAGIPPLPGFFARFLIVAAAWQGGQYGVAAAAVLFSVPLLYGALALIRAIFVEEPAEEAPLRLEPGMRAFLAGGVGVTLFCGLWPGPLLAWLGRLF